MQPFTILQDLGDKVVVQLASGQVVTIAKSALPSGGASPFTPAPNSPPAPPQPPGEPEPFSQPGQGIAGLPQPGIGVQQDWGTPPPTPPLTPPNAPGGTQATPPTPPSRPTPNSYDDFLKERQAITDEERAAAERKRALEEKKADTTAAGAEKVYGIISDARAAAEERYELHKKDLDAAEARLDAAAEDIKNFELRDNSSKIVLDSAVGIMMGAIAQGFFMIAGNKNAQNPVMEFVYKKIEQDVQRQKMQYEKYKDIYNMENTRYGRVISRFESEEKAQQFLVGYQLQEAGAELQAKLAKFGKEAAGVEYDKALNEAATKEFMDLFTIFTGQQADKRKGQQIAASRARSSGKSKENPCGPGSRIVIVSGKEYCSRNGLDDKDVNKRQDEVYSYHTYTGVLDEIESLLDCGYFEGMWNPLTDCKAKIDALEERLCYGTAREVSGPGVLSDSDRAAGCKIMGDITSKAKTKDQKLAVISQNRNLARDNYDRNLKHLGIYDQVYEVRNKELWGQYEEWRDGSSFGAPGTGGEEKGASAEFNSKAKALGYVDDKGNFREDVFWENFNRTNETRKRQGRPIFTTADEFLAWEAEQKKIIDTEVEDEYTKYKRVLHSIGITSRVQFNEWKKNEPEKYGRWRKSMEDYEASKKK